MQTQETIDAGVLSKTQITEGTQYVSQHLWMEWIGDVLFRDFRGEGAESCRGEGGTKL